MNNRQRQQEKVGYARDERRHKVTVQALFGQWLTIHLIQAAPGSILLFDALLGNCMANWFI
jgi:hypothetical protein